MGNKKPLRVSIREAVPFNQVILNGLDPANKAFQLARALLMGEDEFGMEYIAACREGT